MGQTFWDPMSLLPKGNMNSKYILFSSNSFWGSWNCFDVPKEWENSLQRRNTTWTTYYGRKDIIKAILKLSTKLRSTEAIPAEWEKGVIFKVSKKGKKSVRDNWRGITLQTIRNKVLWQITLNRIQRQLISMLRDEAQGFLPKPIILRL
jgi:hypothetical protein